MVINEDDLLPRESIDRLLSGESPIRVWREFRGFTVQTLAEKASLLPEVVRCVETTGEVFQSYVLYSLANALGVPLEVLVGVVRQQQPANRADGADVRTDLEPPRHAESQPFPASRP
jgi:hypothetical protein